MPHIATLSHKQQEAQLLQKDRVTHCVSKFRQGFTRYGSLKCFKQQK